MDQALVNTLEARRELMESLRLAAREITLPLYEEGMVVEDKGPSEGAFFHFDPVTNADKGAEEVLRALITAAFPDDAIEGEEFPDLAGTSGWLWTLDPIDGTRAFVAGVPVWSTLIAVSHDDIPVLGLIDLPALNQSFWGEVTDETKRAWRVDLKGTTDLSSRACASFKPAILGCTAPFGMFSEGERAAYKMVRSGVSFSRLGLDAFGYALVASGRMDIIIESRLKPCDVRALIPVVEGAGGRMTDWKGGSPVDGGRVVAVGDAGLLPELYTYLGRALD